MNRLIKYSLLGSMLLTHIVDAKNIAIVGAKVHTMSSQGTIDNATVLIKNGKIQSVMHGETALSGYEVIDAKGKVVTPGLIGASTSLGLVDVGFSAGTNDSNSSLTSISKTSLGLELRVITVYSAEESVMEMIVIRVQPTEIALDFTCRALPAASSRLSTCSTAASRRKIR